MKHCNLLAFALVALVSVSGIAKAETVHLGNDGYFCNSKGYLAFDYLQNEIQAGRRAKTTHLLKIIRFGSEQGIYFAGEVTLPQDFSIQLMNCNAERIEISGPMGFGKNRRPFAKCTIKIESFTKDIDPAECGDDVSKEPLLKIPSLMIFSEHDSAPINLESPDDTGHKYQLRRHFSKQSSERGLETESKAEVVQTDQSGTILKHLVVYEGEHFEAAD
jgi:hypothetical protein